MKAIFSIGDSKTFSTKVLPADIAKFSSGTVHQLYSTFAIARDAEWCTRLFVLEMIDDDEEGIGTFVEVQHISGALVGSDVIFKSEIAALNNHEIICNFVASVNERIIAKGSTSQKILKKEKLERLLSCL